MNKTYAINLLLKGRICLVVGAGKVARRKIEGLLRSEANVVVVAPDSCETVREMAAANQVTWVEREFEDSDLDGKVLVFAATGDRSLNKRITEMASGQGILCCAVDDNWPDGEFITPATFKHSGIQIAISTDGAACRRTRMIKDNLSKHVEMVSRAELLVLGTDHNYLSLEEREPLHLAGDRAERIGEMLNHVWGVHEFILLNTCNRIEVIAVVCPSENLDTLIKQIMNFTSLTEDDYYCKSGMEAFSHVATALAGLLSQTPGEKHIVAQVKQALSDAKEKGWANSMMQQWMDMSLHISKHIRQQIEPHLRDFEIEDLSIQYVSEKMTDLASSQAIVLGTGIIGTAVVEKLAPQVRRIAWFYHQNRPEVPAKLKEKVTVHNLNELKDQLSSADLIISSAASSSPLIHQGHAPFFDQTRRILGIDLGIPRNISVGVEAVAPNLTVADLDDLKHWFRRRGVDMAQLFDISMKIIQEHQDMYDKILYNFQGGNEGQ